MKYLGIDYGKKKVGLSISEGLSVSPLKVLDVTSLIDAVNKTQKIISDEDVKVVVIGIAESGESKNMTLSFIKALQESSSGIQIISLPETLTTKRAEAKMITFGTSQKSRKKDDAMSAVIILEDFLESQTS